MWGVELTVMVIMIAINGVFAAYEIGLASITAGRLQRLVEESRSGARVALYMKRNMEASLAVVQLGITLVGAIAAAVGGAGAEESLAPALAERFGLARQTAEVIAIALVVIPLTAVMIVFGELIPKVFALRNTEWTCLRLSPAMRGFAMIVWPAVWLFETVVSGFVGWIERLVGGSRRREAGSIELQELRATAALARSARLIGHREERIIVGATEMRYRRVADVMLPAAQIHLLEAGDSLASGLETAKVDMHTRYPVAETPGDPATIIGYVNVKELVSAAGSGSPGQTVGSLVREIPDYPETMPVAECLERLMTRRIHIALVRDHGGSVVGMLTLEDILEELVGEMESEDEGPRAGSPR